MGKNKEKKSIFKVAGAQSLKTKHKAKSVNLNLKKLGPKLKEKTLELDAQLVEVRPLLTNPVSTNPKQITRPNPQIVISQPPLSARDEKDTLDQLGELQFK